MKNTGRDDIRGLTVEKLNEYRLCSDHFEDSQFMNLKQKKSLIWNAVPTLFDFPRDQTSTDPGTDFPPPHH